MNAYLNLFSKNSSDGSFQSATFTDVCAIPSQKAIR